ncbi:flagellar hook-associated protein 1 FlgK [Weissella beninensis]|uniref:Flagellar hook-associated protein 1 n=1 Tax=Periweissella beninensis TaxID=504936 RepID=A0ABT0VGP4_9LACO|nr:flagellar hook-associated protein FlgK [Periweissella beninensis]MBM7544764.1 flagellar hook-associated protein 1 FlgK [Periweissella beninensis]MCM2436991.1 flagellar hook-associated protein FlgK [Periweissella beninensis]
MSLFGTLGTATGGMSANELALQTSSHNIANTNTDGYSRQRVHLETQLPYHMAGVGEIGTGVKASSVDRIVDSFVQSQVRTANGTYNNYTQKSDVLGQLESLFNEPSNNGVISQMNTMFDNWTNLANNPDMATAKTLVVQNSSTLTNSINQLANNMDKLSDNTLTSITKNALDFNSKISQLADVNKQIFTASVGGTSPNDLLDRRDTLLKDLSGITDIGATFDANGRATVTLSGQTVLDGSDPTKQPLTMAVVKDADNVYAATSDVNTTTALATTNTQVGQVVLVDASGQATGPVGSDGQIKGLQAAMGDIATRRGQLNDLAYQIGKQINSALAPSNGQQQFYTLPGKTDASSKFTTYDANYDYAQNLKVNADLVNNAQTLKVGADSTSPAGDGTLAFNIARLANTKDDEGLTFSDHYNTMVTQNGIVKQQADNKSSAQLALLNQLEYKNEAVSGVSINEEMSDVIRFQQGFQANARIISVVSEMLDTLINRTGV